ALALLYEKRGNFKEAIALWELVRRADPDDTAVAGKVKDLAAHETIARGQYQKATSTASGRLGRAEETEESPEPAVARKKPPSTPTMPAAPAPAPAAAPPPADDSASPVEKRSQSEI